LLPLSNAFTIPAAHVRTSTRVDAWYSNRLCNIFDSFFGISCLGPKSGTNSTPTRLAAQLADRQRRYLSVQSCREYWLCIGGQGIRVELRRNVWKHRRIPGYPTTRERKDLAVGTGCRCHLPHRSKLLVLASRFRSLDFPRSQNNVGDFVMAGDTQLHDNSPWSDWRSVLSIVQPDTVLAWHRKSATWSRRVETEALVLKC
jgi:hypothetical protein